MTAQGPRPAKGADAEAREARWGERRYHAELRRRNAAQNRAYQAGRRGQDYPAEFGFPTEDPELHGLYRQGSEEAFSELADRAAPGAPAAASPRPASGGSVRLDVGSEGAGVLLGLIVAALAVNWIRSGNAGVKAWLSAKFLNTGAAGSSAAAPNPVPQNPTGGLGSPTYPVPAPASGIPAPRGGQGTILNPPGSGGTTSVPVM